MSYASYVISGYVITAAALAGYAAWVVSRSRKAHRHVFSGAGGTPDVQSTPEKGS